jgi:hypothetical protein
LDCSAGWTRSVECTLYTDSFRCIACCTMYERLRKRRSRQNTEEEQDSTIYEQILVVEDDAESSDEIEANAECGVPTESDSSWIINRRSLTWNMQ